ncbi:FliH/SctL family protein [Belnapia moabensis]|uniref:hypothetical protein n=1 Tax=Belnapia moabensis TaxID=365533 RepID=UPI0005B944BE|nr:hypothetical protein [Belnapia moabensis]
MTDGFEPVLMLARPRASARVEMPFDVPDLDAPPPPPEVEPAPDAAAIAAAEAAAEAAVREAMLEAARQAGFADGEAAGRTAEAASRAAREVAVLEAIALRLAEAGDNIGQAVDAAATQLAGVLLAALGAALPVAAERLTPDSAAWLAGRLAPLLEDGVAVALHVAPGHGEAAAARLADSRLRIAEDTALAPGAVRAAWRGGGAEFSPEAQRAAIADLLRGFGLSPMTEEK